jgi:predicted ATP-dependent endonuclease of OLD family
MKLSFVEIRNFRKLKSCRVEFSNRETLFVGANNSGKTSAMDALILFLKNSSPNIVTTDFTLSNWIAIDKIGVGWAASDAEDSLDLSLASWEPYLPSLDVWLDVDENDIHYVSHLIPTLDWEGGLLGVRLMLEPKDIEELFKDFRTSFIAAQNVTNSTTGKSAITDEKKKQKLSLWPQSMRDFLDRELHKHFEVKAYILDPKKCQDCEKGIAQPQALPPESVPIVKKPFDGLFKVDIINAQRGFSDPNIEGSSNKSFGSLSTQLRHYFSQHLNPSELPDASDINALEAIEAARIAFDDQLRNSFKPAIGELEGLNYPGFSDPQISLTSNVDPVECLDHDTAVRFNVLRDDDATSPLSLPEQYNGLGYQNLISMVFSLIRFRDGWLRVGKVGERRDNASSFIEPLHIVLIEEPEAHLHAQAQQVFIKKAYGVLRNHAKLNSQDQFNTQMIVSTHSSHIAHEIDFTCLRYFRRKPSENKEEVPFATVVNLSTTFGEDDETSKFATRYLKTTHCDLFFADAAILVEGPAERMLIPHFVRHHYPELDKSYISLLEIGGSHAHRLRPLIESLGLLTLVVTDLDAIGENGTSKVVPRRNQRYRTGNDTLKRWVPEETNLDELLDLSDDKKQSEDETVRVAYQCPVNVEHKEVEEKQEAIPSTFEDALVLTNMSLFKDMNNATGLIKKLSDSLNESTLDETCQTMFEALKTGKKAEMALELLYITDPDELNPPAYIVEGLQWLQKKLDVREQDFLKPKTSETGDAA